MNAQERAQALRDTKPDSWVALSEDESRVVGHGDTYREAVEEARRNGEEDPLLIKTPEKWNDLVLTCA
jgi:D-serine dehydratase